MTLKKVPARSHSSGELKKTKEELKPTTETTMNKVQETPDNVNSSLGGMKMKIFSIPNLSSDLPERIGLNELDSFDRPRNFGSKRAFIEWAHGKDTRWHFVSAYEGLTPGLRVKAGNEAIMCHGLILDYDCKAAHWTWGEIVAEAKDAKYPPVYLYPTYSGGARMVWPFDKPVLVHESVWVKAITALVKEIRANKILENLDDVYTKTTQYYALYDKGIFLDEGVTLCAESMYGHILKSTTDKAFRKLGTVIPIEAIAKEVAEKYPGKWDGPFELGARGRRFWDGAADNPTAAIVRETGMQCFTGTLPFVPWSQILGARFLKDYEDDRIREVLQEEFYFDGKDYWRKSDGVWKDHTQSNFIRHLRTKGLSTEPKADGLSEIDGALSIIQEDRRIDCTATFFHQPLKVREVGGEKILNVSRVKLLQPHPEPAKEWGEDFPLLAEFYNGWFEWILGEKRNIQLVHYLAWLQHFYKSCLAQKPQPGQAVFLAGPPDAGKNMSSSKILKGIFGDSLSASKFVAGESDYNGWLLKSPVWSLDDVALKEGYGKQSHFAAMIKNLVANQEIVVNEKYKTSVQIEWTGRLVVTCNLEPKNLQIIPNPDKSLLGKIMIFKLADREGSVDLIQRLIKELPDELPYFCRWLVDWEPDEDVFESSRFGITPYHHPEILETVRQGAGNNTFAEILEMHFRNWFANHSDLSWTGTTTELIVDMGLDDRIRSLLPPPNRAGIYLSQLETQGHPLKQVKINGSFKWRFTREFVGAPAPKPRG